MKLSKKVVISLCLVGIFSSAAVAGAWGHKFRGGPVIDWSRLAKEIQKVTEEAKKVKEITSITTLQKEIFAQLGEVVQAKNKVAEIVKQANILTNSVNGLLEKDKYKAKAQEMYTLDFLTSKYGNTPEAWTANKKRLDETYENEYKYSVKTAHRANKLSADINTQQEKILADYTAGVISEKQKEAMLSALVVTSKNANAMLANQSMAQGIAEDMRQTTSEKLAAAQAQYHAFGFVAKDDPIYKKGVEDNKIIELPR